MNRIGRFHCAYRSIHPNERMCAGNYEKPFTVGQTGPAIDTDHLMDDRRPIVRVPNPPAMGLAIWYR